MAKKANKTEAGAKTPKRWLRRLTLVMVVIIVGMAVAPFVVIGIASGSRIHTVEDVEAHDVVVVFGAGLFDGRPAPYLEARLQIALDLFEAGKAKVILVSGDNLQKYHNEPKAMREWLENHGVPPDKIVADYAGADTYSTCVRARKIFSVTSAILVSQTYHLPRAVSTCRLVGLDAVGVGDESVRALSDSWGGYQRREILADYKMMLDVVTNRQPILGSVETSVDEALGR